MKRIMKYRMGRTAWGVTWALLFAATAASGSAQAVVAEREPITISIVAVNPSSEKMQVVPIRIDLPTEVTPKDVLDRGELKLEFDDKRSIYYVYKKSVELQPKQTRIFRVTIRDLWFVKQGELDDLRGYLNILLEKLEETTYSATAKGIATTNFGRLDDIQAVQSDDALSRKARIGSFRIHRQVIVSIKEDMARMEKLLTFTGGPPVPAMLEESPLKADAPSQTTTWLVISLIMIFIMLLGGQFFFTWHSRTKVTHETSGLGQQGGTPPQVGDQPPPDQPRAA